MLRLISALAALGATAGSVALWHSWWKTALVAAGSALLGFGKDVWAELKPLWAKRVAGEVDRRVSNLFAGYGKDYAQHLYYKHRTFDVKGFSTQGKFALELETVYVDLSVDPAVVGSISQDPIRLAVDAQKGPRDMFAWLQAEPARPRNFAVVGPPGSGKTTLLKHLALGFSAGKAPLKLTPVLLFLRDHSAAIGAHPELKITEVLATSLKDLPPPAGWFEELLRRGKCLVMFDGLDEVADPALRRKVVAWVERQVSVFGANRFLVSSRPNGYRDNPLSDFNVLRVLPFNREQVERFVRNWYLANELVAYQKDDPGVRMEADHGANDLLARLRASPTLQDLGINPLLLTLIATVHRYRSELPGRRVELFAEICDVFLGKRQLARGLELDMTPAQKVRVLRVLAYEMMCREVREMPAPEAASIIAETLKLVAPDTEPLKFLQTVEDSSALLVQKEGGIYGFAHLVFQEYLASLHIKEEKLVRELVSRVYKTWWHETARLYAAQADASPIVENCLSIMDPKMLLLAVDCEAEALQLHADLRKNLSSRLEELTENPGLDRQLAVEYLLTRRIHNMVRINEDAYIDSSPVTNAEYQLFIDEMRSRSEYHQPDHWDAYEFPTGSGREPVLGLREEHGKAFCEWLSEKQPGEWKFIFPQLADLAQEPAARSSRLHFFVADNAYVFMHLPPAAVLERIRKDVQLIQESSHTVPALGRSARRVILFCNLFSDARDPARALDRDLDVARACPRPSPRRGPRPSPRPQPRPHP